MTKKKAPRKRPAARARADRQRADDILATLALVNQALVRLTVRVEQSEKAIDLLTRTVATDSRVADLEDQIGALRDRLDALDRFEQVVDRVIRQGAIEAPDTPTTVAEKAGDMRRVGEIAVDLLDGRTLAVDPETQTARRVR